MRPIRTAPSSNRVQTFEVGLFPKHADGATSPRAACIARIRPAVPVCPTGGLLQTPRRRHRPRRLRQVHWFASTAVGPALYGARELDEERKVMSKCTLCVDRITDKTLPEAQRKPACVLACPSNARLFGDVHDPASVVSQAIIDRGGYQLMPEWGTQPANHYLPRRRTGMTLHAEDLQRIDKPAEDRRQAARTPDARPGPRRLCDLRTTEMTQAVPMAIARIPPLATRRGSIMNPALSVILLTTLIGGRPRPVPGAVRGRAGRLRQRRLRPRRPGRARARRGPRGRPVRSWGLVALLLSTSAILSGLGGPRRCGAPRGCRAR